MANEIEEILTRYSSRGLVDRIRYAPLDSAVLMARQEKERALVRWIRTCGIDPVDQKRVLEIGCGGGGNLLQFLRFGFSPDLLVGNELRSETAAYARSRLPGSTNILDGDAREMNWPAASFDIVFQSTVFTSILDDEFQKELAWKMWKWVAPGGGVLWYDFIYNNPRNRDVKGVSVSRVRALFPEGDLRRWRTTLAPPVARLVTRLFRSAYTVCNTIPCLRTHMLCWIQKG